MIHHHTVVCETSHLSAAVGVCIIDVELDLLMVVALYEGVQVILSGRHHL